MHYAAVAKFLSVITFTVSASMAFPFLWAAADGGGDARAFVISALAGAACSALLALWGRRAKSGDMGSREATACVALSWIAASFVGCLPYILCGAIPSFTDAYFEAMSGFTTTGASVITALDAAPRGIVMWRATTHWLGGMGIVVLVIAMLPFFGGNMTYLFKAESPGPGVEKVSPRIAEMATALWRIYVGATLAGVLLLLLGGMDLYDAVAHSFAAVSTGGFSTHSQSVAQWGSAYIEFVLIALMFFSGANFTLHFAALRARTLRLYKEPEFLFYLGAIAAASAVICVNLLSSGVYSDFLTALRFGAFGAVSSITTTCFVVADYYSWPGFSQILLLVLMMLGGCAGSTSGAMKCVRLQIVLKAAIGEIKKLIHPNVVVVVRQGEKTLRAQAVASASCFIALYLVIWALSALAVSLAGCDVTTSINCTAATLSNSGLITVDGGASASFVAQPAAAKWVYSFNMLCGRLEIYTLLSLFTRGLWRR